MVTSAAVSKFFAGGGALSEIVFCYAARTGAEISDNVVDVNADALGLCLGNRAPFRNHGWALALKAFCGQAAGNEGTAQLHAVVGAGWPGAEEILRSGRHDDRRFRYWRARAKKGRRAKGVISLNR